MRMNSQMDKNCAYCAEGALLEPFAIKLMDLPASKVYLFREQSHRGRVIVASKEHVGEIVDLPRRDRQGFLDDVARVAEALRRALKPDKINYGAYGDTCGHLHFHLVPKYANDPFEWGETFAMNPQRTFLDERGYSELIARISAALYVGNGFDLRKTLEEMYRDVKVDGKVDLTESDFLHEVLKPLASTGASIASFVELLERIREDGEVTEAESAEIIRRLEGLLS